MHSKLQNPDKDSKTKHRKFHDLWKIPIWNSIGQDHLEQKRNKTMKNIAGSMFLHLPVLVGTDLQFPGPCSWM